MQGHGRGALHAGRRDPVFFLFRRDKGYAGCAAPGAQTRRKDHPGDAFAKSPAAAIADVTLLCGLQGGAAAIRFRGCKDGSAVHHRRTVQ